MGIIRCDLKMAVVPTWDALIFPWKGLWHYAKICDTMTGFVTLCLCTTLHRFQWILPAILCNLTLFCCCCCSQCKFWWFFVRFKFPKDFLISTNSFKKWTKQCDHSTVRQKNEFVSWFIFWKNRRLEKTLRLCLTFRTEFLNFHGCHQKYSRLR